MNLDGIDGNQTSPVPDGVSVKRRKRRSRPNLLLSCHMPPDTWIVGIEIFSIVNDDNFKRNMGRGTKQKIPVYRCLGKNHWSLAKFADHGIHAGKPIRVTMRRLSPCEMDDDNLTTAFKYVRDAIADMLGIDDKDKIVEWNTEWEKSKVIGVRIKMEFR